MPDRAYNTRTHPIDLADGRTLAPGEQADVDLTEDHNARLVEAGSLVEVPAAPKKTARRKAANDQPEEDK